MIRNSDLSIASEVNFYTKITDRLTGLRTEEIKNIKDELRDIGKLTPSGSYRDDVKSNKLKSRIDSIRLLINKIENLPEEIDIDELDMIEEESLKCSEGINSIISEIDDLEDSRNREKYEKGKEALDKLKDSVKRLKELKDYNEEDAQLWGYCKRDIEKYKEEKQKLLSEQKENEEELKKITAKSKEKERDFQVLNDRKNVIDNDVKPELRNYEKEKIEITKNEKESKSFSFLRISSVFLLTLSLIGTIIKPSLTFIVLIILFSILFLISLYPIFVLSKKKSQLGGLFEKIRLILSKYNLSSETFENMLSSIQIFDEEFLKQSEEIQELKRREDTLKQKIKTIKDRLIPEKEQKIDSAKEKIEIIKRKSGENILIDYAKKVKIRNNEEKTISKQSGVLKSIVGESEGTIEKNITFWEIELVELEDYKDKAMGIVYDKKKVEKLKGEKSQIEDELEQMIDRKKIYQRKLEEIERETNNLLLLESDFLHCRTSVDLQGVKTKLQDFLNENENIRDNVLETIKIFDEIESEEKEKVSELFGEDSSISKYFSNITNGLYENVFFSQETGKIEVIRKDGKILEVEKLSGGAYDQLYLSIRLALGEKLLKGNKGFFIMDDPFVKSDEIRLKRQIKMLMNISKMGWQILYFSAKGEIRDILKSYIKNEKINFIEIDGICL